MIIIRLIGGLGNQLFQYGLGRRIAHDRDLPLKLDISGFDAYKLHEYCLHRFAIRQEFAQPGEIAVFANRRLQRIRALLPIRFQSLIAERHFHFDPEVLKTTRQSLYLDGYWQSEKYFKSIEGILREELTITVEADEMNRRIADRIRSVNAVSVHIRRGDYVTNQKTLDYHGVAPIAYYLRAVPEVVAEVDAPHFFVFSDDPDWAKQNLALDHPCTFVSHNGADRNYEDLRLMTLCRHHIIANSSFGWWGAWLAESERQIVVAPKRWFNDPTPNTEDLIPSEWRTV